MRTILLFFCGLPFFALAQDASVKPVKKKVFTNPLVLGSIPKKALSIQYESQSGFDNTYRFPSLLPQDNITQKVDNVQSLRVGYFKNLVTKPKTYITLDAGYWLSQFNAANTTTPNTQQTLFSGSFHSISAATNIFKPLDQKHFVLINTSLELNGNSESLKNLSAKNLFVGGAAIYGWKKGLSSMTGVGVLRAYRLGRVIHTPAILWNKTFNPKWGVEMLLPARAVVRYRPNKENIFTAGFDLEGGQFAVSTAGASILNNTFLQRGEIRPKLGWEKELSKNTRFTLNTGVRINGRLDVAEGYDSKNIVMENSPKTNLFINVGLHVLNLKTKAKKK